jgi:hypothetical protein
MILLLFLISVICLHQCHQWFPSAGLALRSAARYASLMTNPIKARWLLLFPAGLIALVLTLISPALGRGDITAANLRSHVAYLASDKLAGRMTGTPGAAAAEEYVAAAYRRSGLAPAPGRIGYFLDFPLYEYGFSAKNVSLSIKAGDRNFSGEFESDFVPLPFSADGWVWAAIVFAGYGISDPEAGYDDYDGLDVRGKIVLAFRHEPARFSSRAANGDIEYSPRAYFSNKIKAAAARGAQAILFVTDPAAGKEKDDLAAFTHLSLSPETPDNDLFPPDRDSRPLELPAFQISVPFGARLFDAVAAGISAERLQAALDRGEKPKSFPVTAVGLLSCRRSTPPRRVPTRDVAGFLKGSDPALADRWIVVSAHHDHVGTGSGAGDVIYNGADDNASGVSGVLELARVLAARSLRPRHSLLFITFSGEEEGLLGSDAVFTDKLIPAADLVYQCNLDMIGRNPQARFQIIVREENTPLSRAVKQFFAAQPLPVDIEFKGGRNVLSDDFEFAEHGAATFFFFAGLHPDYHTVRDEADRLDYAAMETRVRLAYDFILFLDSR